MGMLATEQSAVPVRGEMERILASAGFARSERLSRFLRFVVEQQLEGRADQLKESVVGVEVFDRKPDYDPRRDPVVRMEAAKLRARLAEYYAGETAAPLVIELPKGGYAPVFRNVAQVPDLHFPTKRLWLAVAMASFAVVTAAAGWWRFHQQSTPIPIAVLPLKNLSQNAANDYFADGLTGEIIRNLSIIDGLAVRSQTSSFAFRGKPPNIREAGKQLGADYILEGSVLRAGQQLRINAQLVRVRDDLPVWSGRYDREMTDIFAIQDEISRGIVNNLRLKLGRGRRRYETSVAAYDLYLRARALPVQQYLRGYDQSIGPLEAAIAEDPSFAPAYADLAAARVFRTGQFRFDIADELAKMRATAHKAIQLDPLLAEAWDALGMVYARDAQWEQSEKSFRRAIELDRGRSMSYDDFAMFLLLPLGRIDEAIHQLRIAEKADPLSPHIYYDLAVAISAAGREDEADRYREKLPADYLGKIHFLAATRLRQGRTGEAIRILETAFNGGVWKGVAVRAALGCAYAQTGRRDEAEKLAAFNSINPFEPARIYVCLGDKDRAFQALDRAAAAGPIRIGWALVSPEYALLRGDPRVKALRKKVGLPE